MSNILVSYFSASGRTKEVAEKIATAIDGDVFEIEPVDKYTEADLDWTDKKSRSTIEMNNKEFRPPVKNKVKNIDEYDTVIIGFPVWWYTAPTIINTFIEENKLSGKNAYVFVTSGGSGYEGSLNNLKDEYKDINFISGKRFKGIESDEDYRNWVKNNRVK